MHFMGSKSVAAMLFLLAAGSVRADDGHEEDEHGQTITLNGAGTTNPKKFFWKMMDLFEERSRVPLKMTYRAVGSGTGIKEFVGQASNNYQAYNDFGAGDIPLDAANFATLGTAGREMIHIPFVLGAIGLFHSVPSTDFSNEIDLDACLLARIFVRDITTWDHPDILAKNPTLSVPTGTNINVVHRTLGSSSTAGVTEYLQKSCPASWGSQTAGSISNWHADTIAVYGSGQVESYITNNPYSIGYLDSGHGSGAGLEEIALENNDGVYLKSQNADIGAAGTVKAQDASDPFPAGDASWADVNLYDLSGPTTWPITMFSYFYLPKNMTDMDVDSAAVLIALVDYALSADGLALAVDFGFVAIPSEVIAINQASLNLIIKPEHYDDHEFVFEGSTTEPYIGAGDHTISAKRRSYAEYERSTFTSSIAALEAEIATLRAEIAADDDSDKKSVGLAVAGFITSMIALALSISQLIGGRTNSASYTSTPDKSSGAKEMRQREESTDSQSSQAEMLSIHSRPGNTAEV